MYLFIGSVSEHIVSDVFLLLGIRAKDHLSFVRTIEHLPVVHTKEHRLGGRHPPSNLVLVRTLHESCRWLLFGANSTEISFGAIAWKVFFGANNQKVFDV